MFGKTTDVILGKGNKLGLNSNLHWDSLESRSVAFDWETKDTDAKFECQQIRLATYQLLRQANMAF